MPQDNKDFSRRDFFRVAGFAGAAGVGSLMGADKLLADEPTDEQAGKPAQATTIPEPPLPLRPLGKTGANVPILALGGVFDITQNQLMLNAALKYGVTYWDTANQYVGGKSEEGIGMFFGKKPEERKKVFLVSKAASKRRDPEWLDEQLQTSFDRMKTDYIDLYYTHSITKAAEIDEWSDKWKVWAEKAKAAGKIRHFGFSTHKNMAENLMAASKLGFIDAIMVKYNFNHTKDDQMQRAVDACHKAGIGLIAMKTQVKKSRKASEVLTESELAQKLMERGFTPAQTNLKMVWSDERFASICSAMYNIPILQANVAAAKDQTKLAASDQALMQEYAKAACDGYCAGCADICESAVGGKIPVSDVMRYLMYYNEYGDQAGAREKFASLPAAVRSQLASVDYTAAQRGCPQNLPIAELMAEASVLLA